MGRDEIVGEIRKMAARALEGRYGIELVDVRIKYINYVEAVIPKIYDRMRSERIRIANKYESEGRREEAEILGSMKRELERIQSEGYRTAGGNHGTGRCRGRKDLCRGIRKARLNFIPLQKPWKHTNQPLISKPISSLPRTETTSGI